MSHFDPSDIVRTWPKKWRDEFYERAAIMEIDAELHRGEAEARAFAQTLKLMRQAAIDIATG